MDMDPNSGMADVHMAAAESQTSKCGLVAYHPVKTQMLFKLTLWRFEDYEKAIVSDKFFCSVMDKFATYPTELDSEDDEERKKQRMKLLEAKYFVAGGSAMRRAKKKKH